MFKVKVTLGNIGRAGTWQPWVLKQDKVWIDRNGDVIEVSMISGRYALNILKFVYRMHRDDIPGLNGEVTSESSHGPLWSVLRSKVTEQLGLYPDEIATLVNNQPDSFYYPLEDYEGFDDLVIDGVDSYGSVD
jgi:hypothetical protein